MMCFYGIANFLNEKPTFSFPEVAPNMYNNINSCGLCKMDLMNISKL
jgi:hypothetical protein